jgi:hypothetical protein
MGHSIQNTLRHLCASSIVKKDEIATAFESWKQAPYGFDRE